ncbi:bacteriocin immunity protein [Photorhabdus bodei]|uniref:Bacteriocin immunity protein n=1 Tax=Photorhabdus bodei TaxID=2029681 RepID=A0A329X915_9GAMM|nr:bacteriocin immunity protein [Photorhabdus bodei]NDK99590.1 bacteriocin immunity protein [Photorhabdus bodei]NDL03918.1 bacteriocin immunity protein [Photorhabdus bodei]NDL07969.1 bacteriocin immunity protein [Photorhabdus bodei]RAX13294.1 bacteriocin immunity protein [Photorhabdus bodei]
MELKSKLEEYTETEFLELISMIFEGKYSSEAEHDAIVNNIVRVSEYPAGTDLLYYPEDGIEDSPEGVLKVVKEWRARNGKPGFKE